MEDDFTWCVVRPDMLVNENVSNYLMMESPPFSTITNYIPTSRINVAHFMSLLIESDAMWNDYEFKMPVIMNYKPYAVEEAKGKERTRPDRARQEVEKPNTLATRLINDNDRYG